MKVLRLLSCRALHYLGLLSKPLGKILEFGDLT